MKQITSRLLKSLIITAILLLTLTNNNLLSANGTDTTQQPVTSHELIVVKDKYFVNLLIKFISNKYPDLKLDYIKEIGVIQIEHPQEEVLENASKYIHKKFKRFIVQESEVMNPLDLDAVLAAQFATEAESNGMPNFQNDPNVYSYWQWGVNYVTENKKSYSITKGSHDVSVAILDSGIDLNHPDLADNIISPGQSFVPGEPTAMDYNGHGTKVAGIIAANGNLTGIGPEIGIVPYKVFSREGGRAFWMIQAMVKAANDGHEVLNISSGIYQTYSEKSGGAVVEAFQRAIDYTNNKGSVIVNSAGNEGVDIDQIIPTGEDGRGVIRLPSVFSKVITVGASTLERMPAPYSNYGKKVDFYAPGGSYGPIAHQDEFDFSFLLLTTYPTYLEQSTIAQLISLPKGYDLDIGTSLATPAVSATYALVIHKLKENKLNKAPEEISSMLREMATQLSVNDPAGRTVGMVNAFKALQYVENESMPLK